MREKRWLYFALGVAAVVSVGAVTNQVVSSSGALVLRDDGIQFPDGTVQTTATMDLGSVARSSFRYDCSADLYPGSAGAQCSFPAVPNGKIAVVEHFEGRVQLGLDQRAEIWLEGPVYGAVYIRHQYTNTDLATDYSVVSELHRMYLDEGQAQTVEIARNSTVGGGFFQVWITGYLVEKTP